MQSTRLAKAAYWVGGQVSRIKRPMRLHTYEPGPLGPDMVSGSHWAWMSVNTTWLLLALANRLDRQHFDHWALEHTGRCRAVACMVCGGFVCNMLDEEDEDDE